MSLGLVSWQLCSGSTAMTNRSARSAAPVQRQMHRQRLPRAVQTWLTQTFKLDFLAWVAGSSGTQGSCRVLTCTAVHTMGWLRRSRTAQGQATATQQPLQWLSWKAARPSKLLLLHVRPLVTVGKNVQVCLCVKHIASGWKAGPAMIAPCAHTHSVLLESSPSLWLWAECLIHLSPPAMHDLIHTAPQRRHRNVVQMQTKICCKPA